MANGLERLERLFVGPKRRERPNLRVKASMTGPTFPAPSFMRPTSYQMAPREERRYESRSYEDRVRSQSLPLDKGNYDGDNVYDRPLSTVSSTILIDPLSRNDKPSPQIAFASNERRDSAAAPMLSPFRFPEDSLFKNEEFMSISGSTETSPSSQSRHVRFQDSVTDQTDESQTTIKRLSHTTSDQASTNQDQPSSPNGPNSSFESSAAPVRAEEVTPANHISMLFKPIDFGPRPSDARRDNVNDVSGPMVLLPSPTIVPASEKARGSSELRCAQSTRSTPLLESPIRQSSDTCRQKFSLFPRQDATPPYQRPHIDSPPPSDYGEEASAIALWQRFTSPDSLPMPSTLTPRHSAELFNNRPESAHSELKGINGPRETWGSRSDDPQTGRELRHSPMIPRSRLRKSISEASLGVFSPILENGHILKEPSVRDFLTLSDEDIAEELPACFKSPDHSKAPFPPPKDIPKTSPKTSTSTVVPMPSRMAPEPPKQPPTILGKHSALNPTSGEVTPPYTPVDGCFNPLTCPLGAPASVLGARLSADLAKKYKLDLVYVISLWPCGPGTQAGSSSAGTRPSSSPAHASTNAVSPSRKTNKRNSSFLARGRADTELRTTGCFLGAYGLTDVAFPVPIVNKMHLKVLGLKGWKEYRNHGNEVLGDANNKTENTITSSHNKGNQISRGWVRSFYPDVAPTSASTPSLAAQLHISPRQMAKNRGIIFGAYVKHGSAHMSVAEPNLDALYVDAKAMVDAIVEQTSRQVKTRSI